MNYEKNIENITKMSISHQDHFLRIFARSDLEIKLEIFKKQKEIFHKFIDYDNLNNTILTYISFVLAIKNVIDKMDDINFKASALRKKYCKRSLKKEKLLERWAIIKTLKIEQNLSFRQISYYLKKYHKIDISYSTIYDIWRQIEIKNTKKSGEKND